MGQKTYYINCPYCTEIVEVVNPRPNSEPSSVKGERSFNFWASESIAIACPKCKKTIWMEWKY